jgi:large subunit ribosomal protein L32e
MTKEEVLNKLTSLNGIGQSKAEALVKDGYDTIDKINKASIDDLTKVNGISKSVAESIKKQLKEQKPSKTQEKPKKQIQAKEIKPSKTTKKEEKPTQESKKTTKKKETDEKEGYIVKKKPVIDTEIKKLLVIRKQIKKRTPDFLREEWFRYKKLAKNWRRPDGITSSMRVNKKYRPSKVRVGFRGPKKVRGIHPSGFEEIMIFNASDLDNINPKTQAARIGSSVGTKKRIEIEKKAKELDVRLLNL